MAKKRKRTARDEELSSRKEIRDRLLKIYEDVRKGFEDQRERSDDILDYWDVYNAQWSGYQQYNGRAQIYLPLVRDAVEARKTRFINQIFPTSGRYIETIGSEPDDPWSLVALLEHYVRSTRLRTEVMPALMVNGDVEGQYSLYVDWKTVERFAVSRETRPVQMDGAEFPELGHVETIKEEKIEDSEPCVEVIADADLLVYPATVDRITDALAQGGGVALRRRLSKKRIKDMARDGTFADAEADALEAEMAKAEGDGEGAKFVAKELADDAGIKVDGKKKFALVYEVWTMLEVDDEMRICRAWFGGPDKILGCKLNPNWSDRVNVLSAPVKKIPGVFKGKAPVATVCDLQYNANDKFNQAMDSVTFNLSIVTTVDPERVSRWQELVLDQGAVWPVPPDAIKQLQFADLTEAGQRVVEGARTQIFQSLGVSPSMIPQQTGNKSKRNQAEIALEQQVDVLTTADAVTIIEGEILTPMMTMFMELDHQHRDKDVWVQSYGELGLKAEMEQIPPIQVDKRFELRWFGVEAARNAQQIQQMIAAANVMRGIPPQMYAGHELDMAPLLKHIAESAFGARLGRQIFKSLKDTLAVDPEQENQLLAQGFDVLVHAQDDDPKHLQAHQQVPPSPNRDAHIARHMMQLQQKQAQQQARAQGLQGSPGGAGPGAAGTPRPGAQPANPRQGRAPNGSIAPDQMARAGAPTMPRKM